MGKNDLASWLMFLVGASPIGCQKLDGGQARASLDSAQPIQTDMLQAQGAGPRAVAMGDASAQPSVGYVVQTALVRVQPNEAKDIDAAGSKRRQPNWTATLYRGERVTVLEQDHAWLQVRTSDEKIGWLKQDNVLRGPELTMATVLLPTKVFTRPDLLALSGIKPIEPGSLLFVLRSKEQFTQVNTGGSTTGWVLTEALTQAPREVDAAKLIHKARLLKDRRDPAATGLLDLARAHFADTRLVQTLLLSAVPSGHTADERDSRSTAPSAQTPAVVSQPTADPLADGSADFAEPAPLGAPGVAAPARPAALDENTPRDLDGGGAPPAGHTSGF